MVILTIVGYTITGCTEVKMKSEDIAINHVIQKTVHDVNKLDIVYHLYLVGTGGSIDHETGKEKTIFLAFQMHHPISKEACRWLIVNIAELLLSNINGNQELSQHLSGGHFTYKNIELSIVFTMPDRSSLYYPEIVCASLYSDKISYAFRDPNDKNGGYSPYKEKIYEHYEEALKIVESEGKPEELTPKSTL